MASPYSGFLHRCYSHPEIRFETARVKEAFSEFVIDFGQYLPENEKAELCVRIVTSPNYAKAMIEALQEAVDTFEQTFDCVKD